MKIERNWRQVFEGRGALKIHDGDPKHPHWLLASRKHSGHYFDSRLIVEDSTLLDEATFSLVELLEKSGLALSRVDRVVGPAMGSITLAHDISRHISFKRKRACLSAFTEKGAFKRITIRAGEQVLVVDDVFTTGGSMSETVKAITKADATVLPFMVVLVNRSSARDLTINKEVRKIVALVDSPMPIWLMKECLLCRVGSKAVRPD